MNFKQLQVLVQVPTVLNDSIHSQLASTAASTAVATVPLYSGTTCVHLAAENVELVGL